jgi:hypothetical protein
VVNLWPGVPATCLCDKHLNAVLAEYNNLLLPSMRKGNSIRGYILHGCVDLRSTHGRILECIEEACKRGKEWKYPAPSLDDEKLINEYRVRYCFTEPIGSPKERSEMNMRILAFRCPECRMRIVDGNYCVQ